MRSFLLERGWRFLEVGDDVDLGRPMFDVSRTEPSDDTEDLNFWKFLALFLAVFEPEVDGSGSTFDCQGLSGVSAVFSDLVSSANFLFLKLYGIKSVNPI